MAIGRVPGATGIQPSIVDAKGDLIAATAADSVSRLAVGTNEQRLVADSAAATGLKYVADTTNYAIAAKGDLLAGTAADTLSALTVGANGTILTADSNETTGLKYAGNWVTFTPASITGFTLGNGTVTGRYCRVGKVTFVYFEFTLGSTSSVTGEVTFQLPAGAGVIGGKLFNGTVTYLDAGTAAYLGSIETTIGGNTLYLRVSNSGGTYLTNSNQSSTIPFTWTNGDSFVGYLWFEVQ
jgi:hypothetical protein